ncbi:hypothetical protein LI291_17025, partial [Intestinibacillus massiliensis]|nr:hypothetical protein [Intestinibacillus massiliensis]
FITVIATGFESRPSADLLGGDLMPEHTGEEKKESEITSSILDEKNEKESGSLIDNDFKIPPFLSSK